MTNIGLCRITGDVPRGAIAVIALLRSRIVTRRLNNRAVESSAKDGANRPKATRMRSES